MKKIAIVVQRYGKEVLGGAETYAQILAGALSEDFNVTVLTTTAKDHEHWKPFYSEGSSQENNVTVIRFNTDFERTGYFHELHRIYLNGVDINNFANLQTEEKSKFMDWAQNLPLAFQDELIRSQGPYSSELLNYIKQSVDIFDKFIFVTYLYPTTYFGVQKIKDKSKILIQTALHDEPIAYLPIWREYKRYKLLFYTEEEKNIASLLWGNEDGEVVGYGMRDTYVKKSPCDEKYLLYAGRIDSGKGIDNLIEYFKKYKEQNPESKIKLKLIGRNTMGLKSDTKNGIDIIGFVDEDKKLELISGALAVVIPSQYESLSIVALESFMEKTPILVNGKCKVLEGHIKRSNGGFV